MNLGRDFNSMIYKDIADWEINKVCLSRIHGQVKKLNFSKFSRFLVGPKKAIVKKTTETKSYQAREKVASPCEVYNKLYQAQAS